MSNLERCGIGKLQGFYQAAYDCYVAATNGMAQESAEQLSKHYRPGADFKLASSPSHNASGGAFP